MTDYTNKLGATLSQGPAPTGRDKLFDALYNALGGTPDRRWAADKMTTALDWGTLGMLTGAYDGGRELAQTGSAATLAMALMPGSKGVRAAAGAAETAGRVMSAESKKFLDEITKTTRPNMMAMLGYRLQDLAVSDVEKAALKEALATRSREVYQKASDDTAKARLQATSTIAEPKAGTPYQLFHGALEDHRTPENTFRWFTTDRNHAGSFGNVSEYRTAFERPAYLDASAVDRPSGRAGDEWLYNYAEPLFKKGHDALFVKGWEGDGMVILTRDDLSGKRIK